MLLLFLRRTCRLGFIAILAVWWYRRAASARLAFGRHMPLNLSSQKSRSSHVDLETTIALTDFCHPASSVASRHRLPSANRRLLIILRCRLSTTARRAFSAVGPSAWNSLLDYLRDPAMLAEIHLDDIWNVYVRFVYVYALYNFTSTLTLTSLSLLMVLTRSLSENLDSGANVDAIFLDFAFRPLIKYRIIGYH